MSSPTPITADVLSGSAVRHGFFTRGGGVSAGEFTSLNCDFGSGDDPDHVGENRRRAVAALLDTPGALVTAYQKHTIDVHVVRTPWAQADAPVGDALVTDRPGIALGILTADCAPVLMADATAGVIGAAHAGWRGAFTGVIEATIAAMEKLGADRGRIAVALGPVISQPNYEVGAEFVERFMAADASNARFFAASQRPGHAMFDLNGYIAARVERAGIKQFEDLRLCTYADPARFYSFRRTTHLSEPDYGRHINAITLTA
jgi:YfiH family protein